MEKMHKDLHKTPLFSSELEDIRGNALYLSLFIVEFYSDSKNNY